MIRSNQTTIFVIRDVPVITIGGGGHPYISMWACLFVTFIIKTRLLYVCLFVSPVGNKVIGE